MSEIGKDQTEVIYENGRTVAFENSREQRMFEAEIERGGWEHATCALESWREDGVRMRIANLNYKLPKPA